MTNPDMIDTRGVFKNLRDFFRDRLLPDLTTQHAANDALELELQRLKDELQTLKGKHDSKRRTANKQSERIAELTAELKAIKGR
jgi:predicted  nucleic acid-binding Zn-ribbon protein